MTLEYCTALLPAPHREEDFQEDHVSRFIADDHTRKALLASFISRAFRPDGQGNNQHAEPPHHSAISEGEDDVPRIAFMTSSAKPNTSLYFLYRLSLTCIGRAALVTFSQVRIPLHSLLLSGLFRPAFGNQASPNATGCIQDLGLVKNRHLIEV
ncbi:hypothetical protein N7489_004815 [Penicillium chrysogenum]|uniref:uncharacterized protein n=1 Tax=Penicillium chrysogenum TaxID=5076 RepID=UPI0024DF2532|nr:uncharacterized protein N7489_004815 [Penicillium chrysogenum]KAJ5244719.1 hypothetical protein N7489_004815 [Penicillium chrysogenum]